MSENILEVRNLEKTFATEDVLKGVSFDVKEKEIVSIIGSSGCGKTTTLSCLNLLEYPDKGEILFHGENILHIKNLGKYRAAVGMVFQNFNLFNNLSVIENCNLGQIKVLKKSKQEAEETSMKYLRKVGMEKMAQQSVTRLSGGQKQRVAIARTLCMNPEIILFDEPTSALDPEMTGEVLSVIRKVAEEGITMIIVTHEMKFAQEISDRILVMDKGYIIEDATPDELFNNPKHERTRQFLKNFIDK